MFKRLYGALFDNFRLKLLALAIALGIWFYANSRLLDEVPVTAAIVITPPPGYALVYQSDRTARLRAEGPRSLVTTLREEMLQDVVRMKYEMTAQDLQDGWATLEVQPDWLRLGLHDWEFVQLRFRAVTPRTVRVFVSPIVEKVLPVQVALGGEPPEGLRIEGRPATAPAQVLVRGPAIAVETMESVRTEEVPLWQLTAGVYEEPRILRREQQVTLDDGQRVTVPLELGDSTALVRLRLTGETVAEQVFPALPLNFLVPLQFPYEVQVEDTERTVAVTVRAPGADLKGLNSQNVRPYVDLTGLADEAIAPGASAPYREAVVVHLPPQVAASSVQVDPPLVTVLLKNPAR